MVVEAAIIIVRTTSIFYQLIVDREAVIGQHDHIFLLLILLYEAAGIWIPRMRCLLYIHEGSQNIDLDLRVWLL